MGGDRGKKGKGQGTCIKDPETTSMRGRIQWGRRAVGRAGENNAGKKRTTVIEPFKK